MSGTGPDVLLSVTLENCAQADEGCPTFAGARVRLANLHPEVFPLPPVIVRACSTIRIVPLGRRCTCPDNQSLLWFNLGRRQSL